MHSRHRKLLLVDHVLIAAVVNAVINGSVAWLLFGGLSQVPLWGVRGIALDLTLTAFLLPLLYCVIATPPVRRAVRDGRFPPLPPETAPARWLPARARVRGLVLGAAAAATAAPATVAGLAASGLESLPNPGFVVFKAAWAAALAACVGPVIVLTALAEPQPDAELP
jgi:hypothetical protein